MRTVMVVILLLLAAIGAHAQDEEAPAAAPGAPVDFRNSLLLLQSEVAGQIRDGTGFVVKGGPKSLALTSYEAVKGAATIHALVPEHGLVMARLLKYAPDANLALLELTIPDLPALPLGDSELARAGEPVTMVSASPLREGKMASAMSPIARKGEISNVLTRPGGMVLQIKFDNPLTDETAGAPIMSGNTGEVVGVAMSKEAAPSEVFRVAAPANLAAALSPDLGKGTAGSTSVRVLDGSQAPVEAAPDGGGGGGGLLVYLGGFFGGLLLLGAIVFVLKKKAAAKFVPFENLPKLPEGVPMAFVDARGNLLPMERETIRIGRADDNDWTFKDASISNYHARIKKTREGTWEVEDLRSTNGTFVGGRKLVTSERIIPGSIVTFGKVEVMLMRRGQVS